MCFVFGIWKLEVKTKHKKLNTNGRQFMISDETMNFKVEKDKLINYAKILHQKELAEGKTDDKFEGFTIVSYCWKALDEYKDEINVTNSLSLFLPLIVVIMIWQLF